MSNIDKYGRIDPPLAAGEIETLVGFLEWQRSTLEWKTRGLSKSDLGQTVGQSSMTLGGILKHMSFVEDHWFSHFFFNRARSKMWLFVDWTATPDWEWTSAALDSPDTLLSIWKASVDASRVALAEALAIGTLDRVSARSWDNGESPTLRWILIHMIAEYARHNGHADLIREVVDGQVGEQVSKPKDGVPPFGHTTQLRIFIDPDLLQYDEVWAAAGTWNDNFAIAPNELVRVSGGVVTDLKRG